MTETNTQTPPAEQNLSEAVKSIVIDNKEIPITEAPEVLKNMESSLRQDYTKKTMEAKQERERVGQQLKTDIEWFNTHDRKIWGLYHPTVEGGAGFIGTDAQLAQYNGNDNDDEPTTPTQQKRAFETDPEIKTLRDRLSQLEAKQTRIEEETFETGKERVLLAMDSYLKKYSNAPEQTIKNELHLFLFNHKRHPSDKEVEGIIKSQHDIVSKIIARQTKGKEETGIPTKPVTATPSVSNATPEGGKGKKTMRVASEPDTLAKSIFARLSGG